jgi:TIR domain/PEGA domain
VQDLTPNSEAKATSSESTGQPTPSSERVFISYAREDEAFVLRLARTLKARGIPVWLDQWDILPGADWNQSIDRALHESRKVIAVLSPAAVASRQVRAEIQSAVDTEEKSVFPVLYKHCDVPRILRLYHFSDFREARNFETELARLADALGATPKPPPPKPPPHRAGNRRLMLAAILGVIAISVLVGGFVFGLVPWRVSENAVVAPPDVIHPAPTGKLQVSVNVDEARVSLDGAEVGIARNVVPLILRSVPAGKYRLRVEATGYVPEERRITIIANGWTSEGVALSQPSPAPVGR